MGLKLITAPGTTPISVAEAKANSRVDLSDEDSLFTLWIARAVAEAENYTGTALISQGWEQSLDAFPEAEIELKKPPVATIDSVKYYDEAGALQTISNTLYSLDVSTFPGWLLPAYDTDWPATQASANAVLIRYTCGYANAAAVPPDIRGWLLAAVNFYYQHRGPVLASGKAVELPESFFRTLDPYRVFKV